MTQIVGDLLVLIRGDAKPLTTSLTQASASTKAFGTQVGATTAATSKSVGGLGGTFQKFGALGSTAFLAVGAGAAAFLKSTIDAASEAQTVLAQTNAVIKSTGGAAGVTAAEVSEMAAAFQDSTTFSDEAVQSAENLLLTFTKIGSDTLPDATQAVLDMSTALGQDLKSSSIQVGKALQNPSIGLTALRRVGISFTDSQVELIKSLDATGRSAEAQRIIIAELNKEFGGSAAARAGTFAGQVEQLGNEFNDLQEIIGAKALPVLEDTVETLKDATEVANQVASALDSLGFSADGALSEADGLAEGLSHVFDAFQPTTAIQNGKDALFNITDALNITEEAGSNAREAAEVDAMAFGGSWQDAADNALGALSDYGAGVPGELGQAETAIDEHLAALEDDFKDTFLEIDGSEDIFGGTVNDFIKDVDKMADQAVRAARNMEVLTHLPIPQAFMDWLETQGPGAIDKFVRANKAGQDKIIADWRRAVQQGVLPFGRAADKAARDRVAHLSVVVNTASLDQLESKLQGLAARYGADFVPGGTTAASTGGGGGGGTRDRNRNESYLDRERFERDHAYSREYEGWR